MTQKTEQVKQTLSPMQEELLARADKIFDWIGDKVDKAGDLAMKGGQAVAEQIPDIAMQYVAFGRASLTFYVILGLLFYIAAYVSVFRMGVKNTLNLPNVRDYSGATWHPLRVVIMFFGGAGGILVGSVLIFNNLKEFFLVWFAPKVWLMLEIVNLVKIVKS